MLSMLQCRTARGRVHDAMATPNIASAQLVSYAHISTAMRIHLPMMYVAPVRVVYALCDDRFERRRSYGKVLVLRCVYFRFRFCRPT